MSKIVLPAFTTFSKPVAKQFADMSKHELYVADIDGDVLYAAYLAAYPEGTNPIYKTRTEHDCSCCKNFIRNIGNLVAIIDGVVHTVWDDVKDIPYPFATVAVILSKLVAAAPIKTIFRTKEHSYGAEQTKQLDDGKVINWNHFYATIANRHRADNAATLIGEFNTSLGVFKRGLEELKVHALVEVQELIASKAIYRGEEHSAALNGFTALHYRYSKLTTDQEKQLFLLANGNSPSRHFRNTVIGTLVTDISDGMDVEKAVKSFESKVAPMNYKRPTALITPRMVDDAMNTIRTLDLEETLERRHAKISDVSINDVLWADNAVKASMKGGTIGAIAATLMAAAVQPLNMPELRKKATEIGVDEFLATILPNATSMDLLVENNMMGNFANITAPVHADSGKLFKWGNDFAWSYDGDVTDSIKQRVKAAGGVTDAVLRVSLAWFNYDDLDLYAIEPNGHEIYFGNRGHQSVTHRGQLDVDANRGGGRPGSGTREPVENIVWQTPGDGVYKIKVNNYAKMESIDSGFTLEVENAGVVTQFSCPSSPASGRDNHALQITVKNRVIVDIKVAPGIIAGEGSSKEKWDIKTNQLSKVVTVMNSPNHWNGKATGQKHTMFMLEGAHNPLPVRGIYNEFLSPELDKHRKVFEVLGSRTKIEPAAEQLAGLGFTTGRSVVVCVSGSKMKNKSFNIKF